MLITLSEATGKQERAITNIIMNYPGDYSTIQTLLKYLGYRLSLDEIQEIYEARTYLYHQ